MTDTQPPNNLICLHKDTDRHKGTDRYKALQRHRNTDRLIGFIDHRASTYSTMTEWDCDHFAHQIQWYSADAVH